MLVVTDINAVNAAYIATTPRPIRDIMLDIYPDATIDGNGRFHAPHDGYLCPITRNEFRGGEYLPMNEPDDNYRIMGSDVNYPKAVDLAGEIHEWNGTRAQNLAVWGLLIEQSKAHDVASSQHVGVVGEKVTLELTIQHIASWQGAYGMTFLHILKDAAGNVFVYKKSGSKIPKGPKTNNEYYQKGDAISLVAKIKSHGVREDVQQTVIERPKVV